MIHSESFGKSTDYSELNNGLHRRSVIQLKPPLLAWHLSFWRRDLDNRTSNLAAQNSKSLDKIDGFIIAFYKRVRDLHEKPEHAKDNVGEPVFHSERAHKAILLNHILDMPKMDNPRHRDTLYDPTTGHPFPNNGLVPIQRDLFESSYRDITIEFTWKKSKICVRIEPHTEFVTISFFVNLSEDNDIIALLDRRDPDSGTERLDASKHLYSTFWANFSSLFLDGQELKELIDSATQRPPVFGHVFGEFRGVILGMPKTERIAAGPAWGQAAITEMLPLITKSKVPKECCANYFLNDRALYMSTLGYENFDTEDDKRVPIYYIMKVPSEIDPWQLGRLAVRLHFLGTLRLAAIRSLSGILRAGRVLTELEPLIKRARDEVSKGGHEEMTAAVKAANAKFDEIHTINPEMLFRIERSRYYVQQFTENVGALRIKRLEGYQKYDDFVRRRLGATIDFIDRLGKRYERAATNLALLQQYAFSSRANAIAKGGEAALFLFLIPYYFSSLSREIAGNDSVLAYFTVSAIVMSKGGMTVLELYRGKSFERLPFMIRLCLGAIFPAFLIGLPIWLHRDVRSSDPCKPTALMTINSFLSEPEETWDEKCHRLHPK